jgi:hypothetical protein
MRARAAVLAALLLAAGCTGEPAKNPPKPAGAAAAPGGCPASYAAPDPDRPRITLDFSVDSSHGTVTGSERVAFTPDAPVTEVVFRLWPNRAGAPRRTVLEITGVDAGRRSEFSTVMAGGRKGTPGTLLRIPLGRTAPAGDTISVTVQFVLILGDAGFERWGRTGATAWWGTGHPLLAWRRGAGWQTTPAGPVTGEYAMSEAARYDVSVQAPAADTVLLPGTAAAPAAAGAGRRIWRSTSLTARDVSVVVGAFATRSGAIDGKPVTAAVASDARYDPAVLLSETLKAVRGLGRLVGPYPYATLTAVVLPALGAGGIEFPGMFFTGPSAGPLTIVHEAAHQWFYGLVGDDQAADPWLDEAFASYAQSVLGQPFGDDNALTSPGRIGAPMSAFDADLAAYSQIVYHKGAAALLAARADAGAPAFDAALRCYVNATAWRVAKPDDVRAALADLPKAVRRLEQAGAW